MGKADALGLHAVWGTDTALLASGPAAVLRSTNRGATWSSLPSPSARQLWSLAGGALVTVSSSLPSVLRVSDDGGATWVDRTPPGARPFVGVPLRSSLWLLGGDATIYRSDDAGRSWSRLAGLAGFPAGIAITGGWVTGNGSVIVTSQGTNAVWRWGVP